MSAWRPMPSLRPGRWTLLATLALVLMGSMSPAPSRAGGDPWQLLGVQRVDPPTAAPQLRLPGIDGHLVGIGDLHGAVVLLGFFTTT